MQAVELGEAPTRGETMQAMAAPKPAAGGGTRAWRAIAVVAIVLSMLFCGAMIGLAISLSAALSDADSRACAAGSAPSAVTFPPRVADVFAPFTQPELDEIAAFVRAALSLDAAEPESLAGDWLYALDFLPDAKATALAYVDGPSASYAGRSARAVVYHLKNSSAARIVEYKVGPIATFPLVANTPVTPIVQGGTLGAVTDIPFLMRPISSNEYAAMEAVVVGAMTTLANLSTISYGETYDDGNMWWTDSAPRGYTRATRQTWIWFMWYKEGMYGLPIGLQMLLDHSSLDSSQWSVLQLAYNAQGPYATAAALAADFNAGKLDVLRYPRPASNSASAPLWTSMRRRGAARALESRAPPSTVPQGGDRFAVQNNQVSFLSWDFHIGYEISAGITFHDIRFRNERVIYELALQDAYASYSGTTPIQALSQYSDAGWGMGYSNFKLIPGVDCPAHATFLSTSHFVDGASNTNVNSVCVWEHPEEVAIMRHYDQDFAAGEGFMFATGAPKTVLVVRTTSTVYNYDYYYNYIFHTDGTIEVTSMASGYLQADTPPTSTAARAADAPFASIVQTFTQGNLHDHLFGYKVDLDVAGTANSLMRSDTLVGTFTQPWNFGVASSQYKYKYAQKTMVAAEGAQSTYNVDPSAPSMFMVTSPATNAWGVARSWGIQIPGSSIQLLDDTAPFMPASQWTKYNVAVTRRSENEQRSCRVLYDMQAPSEPLVEFDDFLNGESLVAQDLVAWVMVGSTHLPSSEDVPVTTTSTTTVRFFIRPLNFFNESPAVDLQRTFFATGATYPDTPELSVDAAGVPASEACYDDTAPYAFAAV